MSLENPSAIDPKLVDRVKGLITKPKYEWPIIAAETTSVQALFKRYAMILAAIPPVASLIHNVVFDGDGLVGSLAGALLGYGLSLLSVYVVGIVIDGLAQNFGSERNIVQSMKVSVYAMTPYWVAGVLNIIGLSWLAGLFALYSIYLIYLALGPVKHTPADKAVLFTVVVMLVGIVLNTIIFSLIGAVVAAFAIVGVGAAAFALS